MWLKINSTFDSQLFSSSEVKEQTSSAQLLMTIKLTRLFPFVNGSRRLPLDNDKPWFHLFDPVHLLKRICDNWLTAKLEQLELIPGKIAKWNDIIEAAEKENIMKTNGLHNAALRPFILERQNVKHQTCFIGFQ